MTDYQKKVSSAVPTHSKHLDAEIFPNFSDNTYDINYSKNYNV